MNLLILTIIIITGSLSQIEAVVLSFRNIIETRNAEEPTNSFNTVSQINTNREVVGVGFDGNINRSYGSSPWQNLLANRQSPITNGYLQNFAVPENNEDIDPEVAKRFPSAIDLLNSLRELNKLKAEGKLSLGGNKFIDSNNDNNYSEKKAGHELNNQNFTPTESNEDVDPLVAKLFPGGVKLLNRLKELNKLKREGKLSFGGNNTAIKNDNNNNSEKNYTSNGKSGKSDDINKNNSDRNNNKNNSKGEDDDKKPYDGNYFQAQPVIPENERKDRNKNIYRGD